MLGRTSTPEQSPLQKALEVPPSVCTVCLRYPVPHYAVDEPIGLDGRVQNAAYDLLGQDWILGLCGPFIPRHWTTAFGPLF